jgi:hypothetical protein
MKVMKLIGLEEFTPKGGIGVYNMSTMPSKGHFEYAGHFALDMEPAALMHQSGYKGVFISRDLRDVIVSHAHFGIKDAKRQGKHPIYEMFDTGDLDKVIDWLIDYAPLRYWARVGWRNIEGIYSVTYENLWNKTCVEIDNIADHLDIELTAVQLSGAVGDFPPGNDGYEIFYRQGTPGNWKEFFTEEHKEKFKRIAGDILIRDGYEKDMDW